MKSIKQGERLAEAFNRWGVEYLFVGSSGAIFYGFSDVTQGVEVFAAKSLENEQKLMSALREPGYELPPEDESYRVAGKDFVQLRSRNLTALPTNPSSS